MLEGLDKSKSPRDSQSIPMTPATPQFFENALVRSSLPLSIPDFTLLTPVASVPSILPRITRDFASSLSVCPRSPVSPSSSPALGSREGITGIFLDNTPESDRTKRVASVGSNDDELLRLTIGEVSHLALSM